MFSPLKVTGNYFYLRFISYLLVKCIPGFVDLVVWVCFFFFDRVNRKDYSYTSSFGFSSVSPFILTFHKPHFVWVGLFFCHSNRSGMRALCCASKLLCFNQHRNKASKSVIYF